MKIVSSSRLATSSDTRACSTVPSRYLYDSIGRFSRSAKSIAPRNEEALDLDVPQDLRQIAVVRGEQRLEDLPVAVGQVAPQQVVRRAKPAAIGGAQAVVDQLAPLSARQQQQRVVAHLVGDLRFDQIVVE